MSGFTAVRQVDPHLKAQGGFNVRHGYCVSLLLPKRAMGEGSVRQAHTHRVEQEHLGAPAELSQHCQSQECSANDGIGGQQHRYSSTITAPVPEVAYTPPAGTTGVQKGCVL